MLRILITGATGNVGKEVINALHQLPVPLDIIAGVRDIATGGNKPLGRNISMIKFDITEPSTFNGAFQNIDIMFLLRPPQISSARKYFKPLIKSAIEAGIKHIVFLSVQGVEKSSIIPHHTIEKLIVESRIPYTFLRPAYFMQNFTSSLQHDLVVKNRIFLPAGKARFTMVDARDIGKVAALVLTNTIQHVNKPYELTCNHSLTFHEMADKLSDGLGKDIKYISPNLLHFYFTKRKEKIPAMMILVMILLHYFPRFQKPPSITDCIALLTGNPPIEFEKFIYDNKSFLNPSLSNQPGTA